MGMNTHCLDFAKNLCQKINGVNLMCSKGRSFFLTRERLWLIFAKSTRLEISSVGPVPLGEK